MEQFEFIYKGYTFPVMILENGKRLVDLYCDTSVFGDGGEQIRHEVMMLLGLGV